MADKTKTIKNATDNEIDDLIIRLRKENELQYLISDIKRKSTPQNGPGLVSYDTSSVSTEEPIESMYHTEAVEEFLTHIGVLGMHWGRRKAHASSNEGTKAQSKDHASSEDHIKKVDLKSRKLHTMSNAEIKTFNERMQLEKTYKELSKAEVSAGKKFVMKLLGDLGKEAATKLIKQAISGDLNKKAAQTFTTASKAASAGMKNVNKDKMAKIANQLIVRM